MIKYEDCCVGCASEPGCKGSTCSQKNNASLYCDKCGELINIVAYRHKQDYICGDCLEELGVEAEMVYVDDVIDRLRD